MRLSPASKQDMLHTIGLSLLETFRTLTHMEDPCAAEKFSRLFVEKSDQIMVQNTRLFPDTLPCLHALKQYGYALGIVTTKYHRRIDAVFQREQILDWFDIILGGDDVKAPKPSPEGIVLAMNSLHCSPSQVLYVGDSIVDAKTAQAACVDFAGVLTGTTLQKEFASYPTIGIYPTLSSLCTDAGLLNDREAIQHV